MNAINTQIEQNQIAADLQTETDRINLLLRDCFLEVRKTVGETVRSTWAGYNSFELICFEGGRYTYLFTDRDYDSSITLENVPLRLHYGSRNLVVLVLGANSIDKYLELIDSLEASKREAEEQLQVFKALRSATKEELEAELEARNG